MSHHTVHFAVPEAACERCGCTDSQACPAGCWWIRVDREARLGLCSACATSAELADALSKIRENVDDDDCPC